MKCKIIKIGGVLIEDDELLNRLCRKLSSIASPFVIVHGGGTFAGRLAGRLGIPASMIDGRRVTDRETLEVTGMVYAGCDLNLVRADKRVRESVDWGYVGDIRQVHLGALELLLQSGVVPVISPITHNGEGVLLNSNADGIAAAVAETLSACYDTELVYCFDKKGVLADMRDEGSVIARLTPASYDEYKRKGMIHSGMIPKLDNAFKSVRNGVGTVRLLHPDELDNPEAGTEITLEEQWMQMPQ